jgi:hypothetical protein
MSDLGDLMLDAKKAPAYVRYRVWHDHGVDEAAREANGRAMVGVRRIATGMLHLYQPFQSFV